MLVNPLANSYWDIQLINDPHRHAIVEMGCCLPSLLGVVGATRVNGPGRKGSLWYVQPSLGSHEGLPYYLVIPCCFVELHVCVKKGKTRPALGLESTTRLLTTRCDRVLDLLS